MKRLLFFILIASGCCFSCFAEDFTKVFGKDWTNAAQYVEEQRRVWTLIFDEFSVPADIAEAIVFPEQIRYSALRNRMETAAVKSLYVQGGARKANFSIGRFQMKPSFAEEVEWEWMQTEWRNEYEIYFDLSPTVEARRRRIRRLDSVEWQCIYLSLFLKLLYRRYPQLEKGDKAEQVRFCATAYNVSFRGSYEEICGKSRKACFHTDFIALPSTAYYRYADVAVHYYNKMLNF